MKNMKKYFFNLMKQYFERLGFLVSLFSLVSILIILFIQKSPLLFSSITVNNSFVKEAVYWKKLDSCVKCELCPNNCFLVEGAKGKCKVRMNKDNTLYTEVYGQPAAINVDPIEKKPVYHMLPGSRILSIATVGCPLNCTFCQNWNISQAYPEQAHDGQLIEPEAIISYARENNIPSIAYTYSEPVIFYEYMLDTAKLAKKAGLKNVMVTSGYINPEPLKEIVPYFDVIKVDLKGFSEGFYMEETGGHLANVLQTLKILRKMNILVEIVNLVIPQRNDSDNDIKKLCKWVYENMGPDTPVFFTRYFPNYKLNNLPVTPLDTLLKARKAAIDTGLRYVYIGNAPESGAENTYCPYDGTLLIEREGYWIKKNIIKNGRCPVCGRKIPGIWE